MKSDASPSPRDRRARFEGGGSPLRMTLAWVVLAALMALLGCAKPAHKSEPQTQPAAANEVAEQDSGAHQCDPNGPPQIWPLNVDGRQNPKPCTIVPPSSHACLGDTINWNSNAPFDVTITFEPNGSPFAQSTFIVRQGRTLRLAVINHHPTPPTAYHFETNPPLCNDGPGPLTPPEVVVDN